MPDNDTRAPAAIRGRLTPAAAGTPTVRQEPIEHAAWAFYMVAAAGSTIGQIWVAVDSPPWPASIFWWARALLVFPFAIVIDLGGVVAAAFGDARRRLGEAAHSWRILSAGTVTLGVAINVLGHRHEPYLAAVFGGLGTFAYTVWTLHSAARRRDALRAAGKLTDTGPVYGFGQWLGHPGETRRARSIAVRHGYPVQESLSIARRQLRDEKRTAALTRHVHQLIKARHDDPVVADIAATTLDIAAIAVRLTATADVDGWARVISASLTPPAVETGEPNTNTAPEPSQDGLGLPKDILRRIPVQQADYDQWRHVWQDWQQHPAASYKEVAAHHHISHRQAQWVRAAGNLGLLDEPLPPLVRVMHLLRTNHRSVPDATIDS